MTAPVHDRRRRPPSEAAIYCALVLAVAFLVLILGRLGDPAAPNCPKGKPAEGIECVRIGPPVVPTTGEPMADLVVCTDGTGHRFTTNRATALRTLAGVPCAEIP